MIVLVHNNNQSVRAFYLESKADIDLPKLGLVEIFFDLALRFENQFIIWCYMDAEPYVRFQHFKNICTHQHIMASYSGQDSNFLSDHIGYVDSSPFANPKKDVTYPTWIMSSCVGVIHSEVLNSYDVKAFKNDSFNYVLCSIAKYGQPKGLFCYSVPELLNNNVSIFDFKKASMFVMFKFIKQHYRTRWVFAMFFNCIIYGKSLYLFPFMSSFFVRKGTMNFNFSKIETAREVENHNKDYDVVIPTIGRKTHLYDVLQDLANQTYLPKNVIIIEQNPNLESISDLEYLSQESWPFKIKHQLIHKTGACNARNIALQEVESELSFLSDDDIRIESHIMEGALRTMNAYHLEAATLSCLREGEQEVYHVPMQWFSFGSGCSIVKTKIAKKINFDIAFEFGFGEDSDFGMQLRALGCDIAYLPTVQLLHLKAPFGGFRAVYTHKWANETIQPKPSPTVMIYNLKHKSSQQLNGYKTLLFFKFYKKQAIKNPISYFKHMNARWEKSLYCADQLMKNPK